MALGLEEGPASTEEKKTVEAAAPEEAAAGRPSTRQADTSR